MSLTCETLRFPEGNRIILASLKELDHIGMTGETFHNSHLTSFQTWMCLNMGRLWLTTGLRDTPFFRQTQILVWEAETDLRQIFVVEKISHLLQEALLASGLPTWDMRLLYNMTKLRSYWSILIIQCNPGSLATKKTFTKHPHKNAEHCFLAVPPSCAADHIVSSLKAPTSKQTSTQTTANLITSKAFGCWPMLPMFHHFNIKTQSSLDTNGSQGNVNSFSSVNLCTATLTCEFQHVFDTNSEHKGWI